MNTKLYYKHKEIILKLTIMIHRSLKILIHNGIVHNKILGCIISEEIDFINLFT